MMTNLLEVVNQDVLPGEETLLPPVLYILNDIMKTKLLEVASHDVIPSEKTLFTCTLHT